MENKANNAQTKTEFDEFLNFANAEMKKTMRKINAHRKSVNQRIEGTESPIKMIPSAIITVRQRAVRDGEEGYHEALSVNTFDETGVHALESAMEILERFLSEYMDSRETVVGTQKDAEQLAAEFLHTPVALVDVAEKMGELLPVLRKVAQVCVISQIPNVLGAMNKRGEK